MGTGTTRTKHFVYLFLLGILALDYPLISLFDVPRTVWGIPLLYGYIFFIWMLLIALVGITASARPRGA